MALIVAEAYDGQKYIKMGDGTKVFAQVEGTGKPVVLIHGWGLNHRMWDYQVPFLTARGHQVVTIDLRGFGLSDKPSAGYDYDTWANDTGTVIEALDLQDVHSSATQ